MKNEAMQHQPVQSTAISKLIHHQVEDSVQKESWNLPTLTASMEYWLATDPRFGKRVRMKGELVETASLDPVLGNPWFKRVRWTANLIETKTPGPAVGHRWPIMV